MHAACNEFYIISNLEFKSKSQKSCPLHKNFNFASKMHTFWCSFLKVDVHVACDDILLNIEVTRSKVTGVMAEGIVLF